MVLNMGEYSFEASLFLARGEFKNEVVNKGHGVYEPLSRIIELQGFAVGPKGASKRGAEYIKKCLKLGGQWPWHDQMTEEIAFFYVRREHSTTFENPWGGALPRHLDQ